MFNPGHSIGHEAEHQRLFRLLTDALPTYGPWANRPTAPLDGNLYGDTDQGGLLYRYNATLARWFSTQVFHSIAIPTVLAATGAVQFEIPRASDIYIDRLDLTISQVNAGSGVNFWSWATGTGLTISGGTVDTKLQGAGANGVYAYTNFTGNPVTLTSNTLGRITMTFTLAGAPGNATFWTSLTYRKVGA